MKYAPLIRKAHSLAGGMDYVDFLNGAAALHGRLRKGEFERRYENNPGALVKDLGISLKERLNKKPKALKRYG